MKASDIKPEDARDFFRGILDRNKQREDGRAFKVIVHMSRDEAIRIFAAQRWLDIYREWGVGIEETDFSIDHVRKFLAELVKELATQKGADVMTITLNRRGRAVLADAERHLDRYSMQIAAAGKPKTGGKRPLRGKN